MRLFPRCQEELDALLAEGLASNQLTEGEFWGAVNKHTNALLYEHETGRVREVGRAPSPARSPLAPLPGNGTRRRARN